MYKKCKKATSIKRQKFIEEIFLKCLLIKHYEDITVSEICNLANIPRKAFYRYFETKEGVLHALIDHTLFSYEDFRSSIKTEKRTMKGDLETYFAFWTVEPRKSLLKALDKSDLVDHLYKCSKEMTGSGLINMSRFLPEEDAWTRKQIFNFTITGLITLMLDWFNDSCKQSTEEMAEIACRIISNSLVSKLEELGIYKK